MGMVNQLLASEYTGAKFIDELVEVLTMIMAVVGILFILYAVYIAYLFFTASDEGKRKNAKSRLIKVLASILIVYALATCLRVIDVNFTSIEKNNTTGNSDGINWDKINYEYSEIPVLEISTTDIKKLTLNAANLRIKGGATLGGAKFTSFKFVGLDSTDVLTRNDAVKKPTDSEYSIIGGSFIYYYKAPAKGQGPVDENGDMSQKTYSLDINVGNKTETKSVVYATATFEYAGVKDCVVNFFVELKFKSSDVINKNMGNVPEGAL
ncbi:MAG: hypothetical protein IKT33_01125 [Clostridia bacterium]|nr:hypothetical protein [Clostridia bacterium]